MTPPVIKRMLMLGVALHLALFTVGLPSPTAQAQQVISVEERFQDVFLTAGYCTAFGAAFGTALLAWTTNPSENLNYIAIGASLGFIGGSALGTYVVLQPMAEQQLFPQNERHALVGGKTADPSFHPHRKHANHVDSASSGEAKAHLLTPNRELSPGSRLVLSPIFNFGKTPRLAGMGAQVTLMTF